LAIQRARFFYCIPRGSFRALSSLLKKSATDLDRI
jgi:hypothetical protein